MPQFFDKKYIAFFVLLAASILCSLLYVIPLSVKLHSHIELYLPVFDADIPQLILVDNQLLIKGNLPQRVELDNNVQVIFNKEIVDSMFENVPPKSIFVASEQIWYKTSKGVAKLSYGTIDTEQDSMVIEPIKIEQFFERYINIIVWGVGILLFLLFWLLFYLVSLFMAGVGTMIDAFKSGPYSFSLYLNLGSLFLMFFVFISILFKPLSNAMGLAAMLLFSIYLLVVFMLIGFGKHKQRIENL